MSPTGIQDVAHHPGTSNKGYPPASKTRSRPPKCEFQQPARSAIEKLSGPTNAEYEWISAKIG